MRKWMMCVAVALTIGGPAQAQTMGYADAIETLAHACGGDIERHCRTAQLANFEIGTCLAQHAATVSPGCSTALATVRKAVAARAAAQASVEKVCANDIRRLCPLTVQGRGMVLRCMLKASPSASAKCNSAITAAGWR